MLRYPGQGFLNLNFWMNKQLWDSESLDLGTFMLPSWRGQKFTPQVPGFFCWLPTTPRKKVQVIRFMQKLSLSSNIPTISGYVAGWFTHLANIIQGHPPRLGNRLGFVEESRSQELQQEEKHDQNVVEKWDFRMSGGISGALCVCVCLYIYIYLHVYLSIYKFIYLSIYSFIYVFIYKSIHSLELKGRS